MPNFHIGMINNNTDTEKNTLIVHVTNLQDSLLWQIESILQCDLPNVNNNGNLNIWSREFELSGTVSDENVNAIIGLLRSNGYKDVDYQKMQYPSLQWKNYCSLRTKTKNIDPFAGTLGWVKWSGNLKVALLPNKDIGVYFRDQRIGSLNYDTREDRETARKWLDNFEENIQLLKR